MQNLKLLINLFTLLACLTPLKMNAQVTVGDLKYTLDTPNSGEATVSGPAFTMAIGYDYNSGNSTVTEREDVEKHDVVIPATITYNDATYKVTAIGDGAFNQYGKLDTEVSHVAKHMHNLT